MSKRSTGTNQARSVGKLVLITAALLTWSASVPAGELAKPAQAPANPAFIKDTQDPQRQPARMTASGHVLGLRPSPLDLPRTALTAGPLSLKASLLGAAPASYDLRTTGKLTPVRDQGACGSCWTFGALGSLESNLLPAETMDLSENNMKNTHGFDWGACDGGNANIAMAYLARWSGPINESDDPYVPAPTTSPTGLSPTKHLQEMLLLPGRANAADNETIKQAIMAYGAVETSMYWDDPSFNAATNAFHFSGTGVNSNHSVVIVGWDDNYNSANFLVTPPGNGAFIIRNSWGPAWGAGGYFYISYHDTIIGSSNTVLNGAQPAANFSGVYQYDTLGWVTSFGYGTDSAWFANQFTANVDEQVAAISFYTAAANADYEARIYTNAAAGPVSGVLASSMTGTIALAGYHTIMLPAAVPVTAGQTFSVVVRLTTPGYTYPVPVEMPYANYSSLATANVNESSISSDGVSWSDLTTAATNANNCLKAFTTPTAGCSYSLSSTGVSGAAVEGGSGTVDVTAGGGCGWTAASNSAWITVTSGAGGSGSGTVTYFIAGNSGGPRVGTITIAGQTFSVTQNGSAAANQLLNPGFESGPVSWTESSSGGYSIIWQDAAYAHAGSWSAFLGGYDSAIDSLYQDVAIPAGVSQAAVRFWYYIGTSETDSIAYDTMAVEVRDPVSNALLGTLVTMSNLNATAGYTQSAQYDVSAYAGQTIRLRFNAVTDSTLSTTFLIDDVELGATGGASCTYSISPAGVLYAMAGGSGMVNVTASGSCGWIATSSDAWLTVDAGAIGTGNGTVQYTAASHAGSARIGVISIADKVFTVMQAGSAAGNQLYNPGFENGHVVWTESSSGGYAIIWQDAAYAHAGSWSAFLGGYDSAIDSLYQDVAIPAGASQAEVRFWYYIGTNETGGAIYDTMSVEVRNPGNDALLGTLVTLSNLDATAGYTQSARLDVSSYAGQTIRLKFNATTNASNATFFLVDDVELGEASCAYSINPAGASVAAAGGSGAFAVTDANSCGWTAVSNDAWITVTAGASGTGNGTVSYSVAANAGAARTGTITAAGQTFTVDEYAVSCTYSLSPVNAAISAGGGAGSFDIISAPAGCAAGSWTTASNDAWITVTGGASGTGNGTVSYSVAANAGAARTGTVTAAGQTFTVDQTSGACGYAVTPTNTTVAHSGGAGTFGVVETPAGCGAGAWTAMSNDAWITVTGGASGAGNGTVSYSVAANTGTARTGTITAAGQTFTVNQAPVLCTYGITPAGRAVQSAGGSGSFDVLGAPAGCAAGPWTAVSNDPWLTVTAGAIGTGNGTVIYTVAANAGVARTGTITAAGQTHAVSQDALASCSFSLVPQAQAVIDAGGTGSITVMTNCPWTAVSNDGWITVTSGPSGTGSGIVGYSVASNTGAARSGSISVAGQAFSVYQSAPAACSHAITPQETTAPDTGMTGAIAVTSNCGWTAVSNAAWITIDSGASGTGNGVVGFTAASNTGAPRTGTISVAGQTFTIHQNAAAGCTYAVAPMAISVGDSGGASSVSITAACPWTAVSNDAWIFVTAGTSGTGNGTVSFAVAANPGIARTGTITVAGMAVTIQQDAASCTYALSSPDAAISDSGGGATVTVSAGATCAWSAFSNDAWITIPAGGNGTGTGDVNVAVAPNTGSARTGTISIAGQVFAVRQSAPASCSFGINPQFSLVSDPGGTGTISVTANCPWTAASRDPWITVTAGTSGSGSGTVTYSVTANASAARTGTITVAGQTFTVFQSAPAACDFSITPQTSAHQDAGGTGAIYVGATCPWTAASDASWIILTGSTGATASGALQYAVAPNTGAARVGTITAAGQTFTIFQSAPPLCSTTIASFSALHAAAGGMGTVPVTSTGGCAWTASSNDAWITVTSGASGSGNGTVAYSVAANTGIARTGSILIAGQTFTINQDAVVPTGDINNDGLVNSIDAMIALQMALGVRSQTANDLSRGDVAPLVNHVPQPDGTIDIDDVVLILRKAVNLSW